MDIHTNLSIIVICVPFLKPIIESLSLGIVNADGVTTSEDPVSTTIRRQVGSFRAFYGWRRLGAVESQTVATASHAPSVETGGSLKNSGNEEPVGISLEPVVTTSPMRAATK
jgi:hypothetical protein